MSIIYYKGVGLIFLGRRRLAGTLTAFRYCEESARVVRSPPLACTQWLNTRRTCHLWHVR